jgi:hypothetical protein
MSYFDKFDNKFSNKYEINFKNKKYRYIFFTYRLIVIQITCNFIRGGYVDHELF